MGEKSSEMLFHRGVWGVKILFHRGKRAYFAPIARKISVVVRP